VRAALLGQVPASCGFGVTLSGRPNRPPKRAGLIGNLVSSTNRTLSHVDTEAAVVVAVNRFILCKDGRLPAHSRIFDGDLGYALNTMEIFENIWARLRKVRRIPLEQMPQLYSGSKRRRAENAVHNLRLGKTFLFECTRDFAKNEFVAEGKLVHWISPGSPEYNVLLGTYIRPAEKEIYRVLNELGRERGTERMLTHGLNAVETAEVLRHSWMKFVDPVFICIDGVKRDKNTGVRQLYMEFCTYLECFSSRSRRKLARLLKCQFKRRHICRMRNGDRITFKTQGCRCSGDANTGSGTKLVMCAPLLMLANNGRCVHNNGDDCVIICERSDRKSTIDEIHEVFDKCCIPITVDKEGSIFERLEFCRQQPVFDGVHWRMVTALSEWSRFGHCLWDLHGDAMLDWCQCVGENFERIFRGLPILPMVYKRFLRPKNVAENRRTMFTDYSWRIALRGLPQFSETVSTEARVSFYMAFGITPCHQKEIERRYSAMVVADKRSGVSPLEYVVGN